VISPSVSPALTIASRSVSASADVYVAKNSAAIRGDDWPICAYRPSVFTLYDRMRMPSPLMFTRHAADPSPMIVLPGMTEKTRDAGFSPVTTRARGAGAPEASKSCTAISTAARPLAQFCWVTANASACVRPSLLRSS
jgi:hypothetical protein